MFERSSRIKNRRNTIIGAEKLMPLRGFEPPTSSVHGERTANYATQNTTNFPTLHKVSRRISRSHRGLLSRCDISPNSPMCSPASETKSKRRHSVSAHLRVQPSPALAACFIVWKPSVTCVSDSAKISFFCLSLCIRMCGVLFDLLSQIQFTPKSHLHYFNSVIMA